MKTTVKVSVSGIAFTIDEDAYQILNNYLNTLKKHFDAKPDGKEVLEDIEARMAELLLMRVGSPEQAVTLSDAQEVIQIMGKPSDLFEDDTTVENPQVEQQATATRVRKRLYRDPDHKVIAGVCSGLGNYFNIDTILFRLLFVVLLFSAGAISYFFEFGSVFRSFGGLRGVAIWTYIILWIALPKASTPQQKLEMKGENPSIDDIERRVHTEQKGKSSSYTSGNYQQNSWGIANFIGWTIRIFSGCMLLLIGAVALLALFAGTVGVAHYWELRLSDLLDIIGFNSISVKIILAIIVIYPLAMLMYWGAKLLFRFKLRDKMMMMIGFGTWLCLVAFVIAGAAGEGLGRMMSSKNSYQKAELQEITTQSDTLYVNLSQDFQNGLEGGGLNSCYGNNILRIWVNEYEGEKTLFVAPEVRVRYTNDVKSFAIETHIKTFARNRSKAMEIAENNKWHFSQNDSLLFIQPMMFNKDNPLRKLKSFSGVVIIYAPTNKTVILQEPLNSCLVKGVYRDDSDFYVGWRWDDNDK